MRPLSQNIAYTDLAALGPLHHLSVQGSHSSYSEITLFISWHLADLSSLIDNAFVSYYKYVINDLISTVRLHILNFSTRSLPQNLNKKCRGSQSAENLENTRIYLYVLHDVFIARDPTSHGWLKLCMCLRDHPLVSLAVSSVMTSPLSLYVTLLCVTSYGISMCNIFLYYVITVCDISMFESSSLTHMYWLGMHYVASGHVECL